MEDSTDIPRVIAWYSDGVVSAVAAKLAVEKYGSRAVVVKCDTSDDEHPDNLRFRRDVEQWIGSEVVLIRSTKYAGVDEVFERERYMSGIAGAKCTTELKKVPRFAYQLPDDIHIFGLAADEWRRIEQFKRNNPELSFDWILQTEWIRGVDCFRMVKAAGIQLPAMYGLGFEHNNCLGCVKASSPGYWNKTRKHFPEVFERRAIQSRDIGCRLVQLNGKRIFLDELPADAGVDESEGNIECGIFCIQPGETDG